MPRKTGRRGAFFLPVSEGVAITNEALALSASKTIGGTAYTDRFLGTSSRTAWNKAQALSARVQGIVGEVTISPGAAADQIDVTAFSYHKDNTGVQSAAATDALGITRDSAGAQWNMISVSNATGTVVVTLGAVSASTTAYNDTWGSPGGPALIPVANTLVGVVRPVPGTAAITLSSEIFYKMVDGTTFLQERSDLPGFAVLPVEGGILLNEATLKCHTGTVGRVAYATFTDQFPFLAKVGDIEGLTLAGSSETTEMEAMEDLAPEKDIAGSPSSNGTISRFYVQDARMFGLAMQRRIAGIARIYPDYNDTTKYYEMAIIVTDWGTSLGINDAIKEDVSFEVDGLLEQRGHS